jgi:hypothetical protein
VGRGAGRRWLRRLPRGRQPLRPALAQSLQRYIYGSGNSLEPGAAYAAFRGRAHRAPLLRKRGLVADAPPAHWWVVHQEARLSSTTLELNAPVHGSVIAIEVQPGQQVAAGTCCCCSSR